MASIPILGVLGFLAVPSSAKLPVSLSMAFHVFLSYNPHSRRPLQMIEPSLMQRSHFLLVIITAISLLAVCCKRSSGSSDIKLIEPAKITEIKVTVLDLKIGESRLFKTISSPTEIQSLSEFVNGQLLNRSSLKSGIDKIWSVQDRSAVINISFYESAKYVGTLGSGPVDEPKYFIEYREYHDTQCCKSKAAVLSNDQKEKLFTLLGYSEKAAE